MKDAELLARQADHLVRLAKKATANLSQVAVNARPANPSHPAGHPHKLTALPHSHQPMLSFDRPD